MSYKLKHSNHMAEGPGLRKAAHLRKSRDEQGRDAQLSRPLPQQAGSFHQTIAPNIKSARGPISHHLPADQGLGDILDLNRNRPHLGIPAISQEREANARVLIEEKHMKKGWLFIKVKIVSFSAMGCKDDTWLCMP